MDEDQAGNDPAAAAFERLRGELSLVRRAVEGLTAAREKIDIPDYGPTLTRTRLVLDELTGHVAAMRESPALSMDPTELERRINRAAIDARGEDKRLVGEARKALDEARDALKATARDMGNRLASARQGDAQKRWLWIVGLGGLLAGLILYAACGGPVARLVPTSWQWPEYVATRVLAEPTQWEAGRRLIITDKPDTWAGTVKAVNLVNANQDVLPACERAAAKAKKPVRCTITVKPENNAR
ncbi:DUF6118 family protein [Sphingobium sp. B2]|uniref:DUF6118 family protein n=1 Tax=Sphingobium sp. B2 TaxID=2583228 RepID=UPI0028F3FFDE|nr:DUF6118 family protein [Sphingobium sp. B2]